MIPEPQTTDSGCTQLESVCEHLYRTHQVSLVSFASRRGCDEHEAWDAVQDLFLRLFQKGKILMLATWSEGQQRSWLLCILKRLIYNQHRDRHCLKRGNGQIHESLETLLDDGMEIPSNTTPATEYDRRWALAVMERGMDRLRHDVKPAVWNGFESSLWGSDSPSTPAMRVARHRARVRLREFILCESSESALYQAASGNN